MEESVGVGVGAVMESNFSRGHRGCAGRDPDLSIPASRRRRKAQSDENQAPERDSPIIAIQIRFFSLDFVKVPLVLN